MTNIFVYPQSVLIDSMKQKIVDLRSQMDEIKDEINGNEELGEKVTKVVEKKASPAEFSKYQLFTGELNKIIGLLLILTQRMHRYEMMLNDLDMSEEADRQQKVRNLEPFFILRVSRRFSCHIQSNLWRLCHACHAICYLVERLLKRVFASVEFQIY